MSLLGHTHNFFTLLFLAGTTLMLLFIVFSGSITHYPFNQFYWVQADTSSIANAGGDYTRWTFWGICHPDSWSQESVTNCPSIGPDIPISPFDNFGNSTALPQNFVTNRDTYYYLSRFSFPLLLIALIFAGVSFIGSLVAPCWLAMKQAITLFVSIGLLFVMAGAACATSVSVLTRNQFKNAGMDAKIDSAVMGMVWASVFLYIVLYIMTCCATTSKLYKKHMENQKKLHHLQASQEQLPVPAQQSQLPNQVEDVNQAPGHESAGIRFFKIRRDQEKVENDSMV